MAVYFYTSNKLEILSFRLTEKLRSSPLQALNKEIIIVQNKGMGKWLSLEIAEKNGICSNILFLFPKAFSYLLFKEVVDLPNVTPFSPEIMTWEIMKALPDLLHKPEFEKLKNYIQGENSELRRFQISEKIAYLFDQYLVFRPDLILDWDKGINPFSSEYEYSIWQALLWKHISSDKKDKILLHSASLKDRFMKQIERIKSFKEIPSRIFVFGISTLPPFYLEIILGVSKLIDIHFFYFNPCKEHWEFAYSEKEILSLVQYNVPDETLYLEKGNSLLSSMGIMGREFFSLILKVVGDTGEEMFEDPGKDTLLCHVQSDILNLSDSIIEANQQTYHKYDKTIQIHSCHSPIREVEVLYDNLLSLFEEKQDLLPKDIVVMTPDISIYAPYITAVFDTPEDETKRIPYSLTDTSAKVNNNIANRLLSILKIEKKRFKADAVLDILATKEVYQNFQLSESDIEVIKQWVNETCVHWGIDGNQREELGLPNFHENSWRFGLERMILGYALPTINEKKLFSDILPYSEIEGDSAKILGRFERFCEALFAAATSLKKDRTLVEWSDELNKILNTFFAFNEESEDDIYDIRNLLDENGLAGIAKGSEFNEKVSIDVIYSYLLKQIENESKPYGFINKGVTFCTMLPMRSIPFKVIYMIGMNDGDYPRNSQRIGFNLMENKKRLCDRSKRHEDRYIFLEGLLSARENLIISYVGQSLKDNTEIPPSVLVCELCDYIEKAFGNEMLKQIITKHPLQPFSFKYFKGDGKLFTYSEQNFLAGTEAVKKRDKKGVFIKNPLPKPPISEWKTITIEDLCMFFTNPSKFIIKNRLKIDLNVEEGSKTEGHEPFELNYLDQFFLKEELTEFCILNQNVDGYLPILKASGRLPYGSMGLLEYNELKDEVMEITEQIKSFIESGKIDSYEVAVEFPDLEISIHGQLRSLYSRGQLFYRCSKLKPENKLKAWIYHLMLNSLSDYEGSRETVWIGKDDSVIYSEISIDKAKELLHMLLNYFKQGIIFPLSFFPKTSYTFAESFLGKREGDKALKAAMKVWLPGYNSEGECEDPYINACFIGIMPEDELFTSTAINIFEPMIKAAK
ncbi:MAG: exodeoxyribonuclease V subunit gamma [Desulfobacterales bacterium]|nr:exodeoxyribonuclease V subunit gamma [Desulfobacterales bacterium]